MSIVFEGEEYEGKGAMPADVRTRYEAAQASGRLDIVATDDSGRPLPHDLGAALKQAGGFAGLMRAGKRAMEAQQAAEAAEEVAAGEVPGSRQAQARRPTLVFLGSLGVALVLLLEESASFSYTFDGGRLWLWGVCIGAVAAALVLRPLLPTLRMPTGARVMTALFLFGALSVGGMSLASIANRVLAGGPTRTWSFTITDKRRLTGKTAQGWELRAETEGRDVRLTVPRERAPLFEVGRTYRGEVREGRLGYPFLLEPGLH